MKKIILIGKFLLIFLLTTMELYCQQTEIAKIQQNKLIINNTPILTEVQSNISLEKDLNGIGVFLKFTSKEKFSYKQFLVGKPVSTKNFVCGHTTDIYWLYPKTGKLISEIPSDTQFLLTQLDNNDYVVWIPILDNNFRCSIEATQNNELIVSAESNDTQTSTDTLTGLFIALGNDPFYLLKNSARSIINRIRTGRLREEKPVPEILDYFGWCTWNAFYSSVDKEKLELGLESFKSLKINPKFVILDDGWQDVDNTTYKLKGFGPNEKFTNLGEIIRDIKQTYGIKYFFVWYNILGYWNGTDKNISPNLHVEDVTPTLTPTIMKVLNEKQIKDYTMKKGFVIPQDAFYYFDTYNKTLLDMGVDGIKVDNQATLVILGEGKGGRVKLVQEYRNALEKSVIKYFNGRLINCMSCVNDIIYTLYDTNLMRNSCDFNPNLAKGEDKHIYYNSINNLWTSEFCYPDWDMFETGYHSGEMHAAARAISGGPVYVTDKPEEHNIDILKKLVLSDGTVPRPVNPALPTRDSIFIDPFKDKKLFKIFNNNTYNYVLAVFNFYYPGKEKENETITGNISPSDIEKITGENFAVYAHNTKKLIFAKVSDSIPIELTSLSFEIYTISPIDDGFAVIGLEDKYNSGGCIKSLKKIDNSRFDLDISDNGNFVAYSIKKPVYVKINNKESKYSFNENEKKIIIKLTKKGINNIQIGF